MLKQRHLVALVFSLMVPAMAFAAAPSFVQGDLGQINAPLKAADGALGLSAKAALQSVLVNRLGAVGDEEFEAIRVNRSDLGVTVRFQQSFNGLKVYGANMLVQADAMGRIHTVNGEFVKSSELALAPALGSEDAIAFALGKFASHVQRHGDVELAYVFDGKNRAPLAWTTVVSYRDVNGPQIDRIFADAKTGKLIARHPQVFYAKSLATYDCKQKTPGTNSVSGCTLESSSASNISVGGTIDAPEAAAHNYAGATYDYYKSKYNRDSINGSGMTMKSRVHYDVAYNNAYWDGYMMTYGDGDGSTFIPLSQDADVVAHELTHGVTSFESNLTYSNESGALNESMSDIFGAAVDRTLGASETNTWYVGEDIYVPAGALRNMADPASEGDYDYYPTRYTGTADSGGVHSNSGISNLAFKLLVKGGTHPRGKTSVAVTALNSNFDTSIHQAAQIWYEANANCATASTNFSGMRSCTASKANTLFGTAARDKVHCAWDAVGAPGTSTCGGGCAASSTTTTGISAATGATKSYTWTVPSSCAQAVFSISGGTGDADLYTKFGSAPTTTSYTCRPYLTGNNETCTHTSPSAGTWYINIQAYSTFSGVSLVRSHN